jgi:hypothetical protein
MLLVHTCLLFELGLRLIPVIVKAGLAIFGVGSQGGAGAPVVLNLWLSLMAFCPAIHALNGVAASASSAVQPVAHCADASSLLGWPVRVAVFVVSSLADCSVSQVCRCAVAFLVSCSRSVVLEQVLGVVLCPFDGGSFVVARSNSPTLTRRPPR